MPERSPRAPWKRYGKKWAFVIFPSLLLAQCSTPNATVPTEAELEKTSPVKTLEGEVFEGTDIFPGWSPSKIKAYMIKFTKDFNTNCQSCHDDEFRKIVKYQEITRSMIHLSLTFNVDCTYCHEDLNTLNEKGKVALNMKHEFSDPVELPCTHCHKQQTKFELNKQGQLELMKIKTRSRRRQFKR